MSAQGARKARQSLSNRLESLGVSRPATSIHELRAQGRRRIPRPVFDFIDGGAEDEANVARQRRGLREADVPPRGRSPMSACDLSVRPSWVKSFRRQ